MDIRENSFWYKLRKKLVPILVIIVVAILIWFAFGNKIPGLIPLLKEGDSQKIADYLAQETGIRGVIAVILLQSYIAAGDSGGKYCNAGNGDPGSSGPDLRMARGLSYVLFWVCSV